jgi:hypothetical protein
MHLTDDMAMSRLVKESGLLDLRIPLISSYSAKQGEGTLPPQPGRPQSEGVTSEGQEADIDKGE